VTPDLGQGSARPDEAVPRQRGGAHAASSGSWFRRKSAESPAAAPSSPAVPMLSAPVAGDQARKTGSGGFPGSVPRPRTTAMASPPESEFARTRPAAVRSSAVALCAVAIVAAVVPLVVLQVPDAFAWSLPPRLAGAGPDAVPSLVRASGLALPAMAVAAPLGALAVRRMRPGPVLLAGLLVIAAADVLGGSARTVALIAVDRSLHGLGAGVAMTAVAAIVSGSPAAGRSLAGWWAAVTVAGLAAAASLMRHLVTAADWHAALQPYPRLTGAALGLAALYALLARGSASAAARNAFPVAERSQLALLVPLVAGVCAITVAVTYRGDKAMIAATIAGVIALCGLTVITARAGTAGRFAVVCAVAGFTVAPTASAVTALTQPTVKAGCPVLAAALCGGALALLPRARSGLTGGLNGGLNGAIAVAGLFATAAGFSALYLAGPGNVPGCLLTVLSVSVAGGLAAALTSSLRATGAAGAMAGVAILLAGAVVGYLAAGAVQLHALTTARAPQASRGALVTATGRWALLAAAVTVAVALAVAVATVRRPPPRVGSSPVRRDGR